MNPWLTPQNLTLLFGLLGVIFTIYHFFRNPQIKLDKNESLLNQTVSNVQRDLINLRDNHIHSLDVKLDATNKVVTDLNIRVERLATIIEERIPAKR